MTLRAPPDERDVPALLRFGVVNLDKLPGPDAHQVSAWVRDLVGVERAAHAGTLDPKVTGCLPILLGDATRLAQAFLEGTKEYVVVLHCHGNPPDDIESVLAEFEGPIYQKPPRKSAVKRERRIREIYAVDVLEVDGRRVLLRVSCESGTYIRKLCHDLGLALGTGGHMGDLRRTATDPFDDTTLVTLHDLADALAFYREDGEEAAIRELVQPAETVLTHLPRVTIATNAAEQVANGAPVYAPGVIRIEGVEDNGEEEKDPPLVACYTEAGSVVCLGRLVGDRTTEEGPVVDLERVLV